MNINFCHQCMRKCLPDERVCPACGFEHGIANVMDHVLAPELILDGRYLLGNMQKQEHDCIYYVALDLQNETVVSIAEYFPSGKVFRSGTKVEWSVSAEDTYNLLINYQYQNSTAYLFLENGTIYSVRNANDGGCPADGSAENISLTVPAQNAVVEVPDRLIGSLTEGQTSVKSTAGRTRKRSGKTGKSKNRSPVKTVAAAAATVLLLLGWCGANHLRGNQAMQQEDYAKAVSAYRADFLFSGKRYTEALRLAGEECFEKGDYVTAADYFLRMGSDGEARWSDAVYEQAVLLIQEGKYEEAITTLENIAGEERAAEQKGLAQLEIAKELYRSGRTNDAITLANSIENTKYANVIAFLNNIYLNEAEICVDNEDFRGAIKAYKKCQDDAEAAFNLSVFENLMDGDPYLAATAVVEDREKGTSGYTIGDWYQIFEKVIDKLPAATDLNVNLSRETAKGLLDTPVDFNDKSHVDSFKIFLKGLYMIDTVQLSGDDCFVIKSMTDVYNQCGTAPAGKILIVLQTHSFPDKTATYIVSNGVMSLLPAEYRPASLEEVEYVVMINYNYSKTGKYTKGTVAVCENAKITVYRMPEKKNIASSSSMKGDRAPNSFSYYGTPPAWYSGGAPDVSKKLVEMLKKIM